jgi:multiple sugar transport system permease protein
MTRLRRLVPFALLGPYLLGIFLLVVLPSLATLAIAFTRYNGMGMPAWVGGLNFQLLRREPLLGVALANSYRFILLAVPMRLLGALGLALFFNHPRPGSAWYRAAVYLPTVIPDVAYALLWTWIFNPLYGPLNQVLGGLGLPTPGWLTDGRWGIPAMALMAFFQLGEGFVILLAGLRHISKDYYEAARVDGASVWQAFMRITLPLLTPWLVLLSVRDVVLSFQNTFTPAYIMTGGGPYYATLFVPMLIQEISFDGMRFGEGAALTVLVFVVTVLLSLVVFSLFEGWGIDEDQAAG